MSSVSSSLPAGVQVLANDGLLPSGLTSQQLQNASPGQLTQLSIDNVELSTVSSLFTASSTSSSNSSDSVAATLLGESSSSVSGADSLMYQALESAAPGSNANNSTSAGSNTTGSLFSYLG